MPPLRSLIVLAVAAAFGVPMAAGAQAQILVNTTEYIHPVEAFHCVAASQPCSFNAAIERGQSSFGAVVSACFEAGNPRCLQEDDPNYDPATGLWRLQIGDPFDPFIVDRDDMIIDFTANIEGWAGPQDNRVAIEIASEEQQKELFLVEGSGNQFAGFQIVGQTSIALFVVRAVVQGSVAADNVFGPGLVLAGQTEGVGIRMRGPGVTQNRVVGSWCGVQGDGTDVAGLAEHCVEITEGANRNTIGGPNPEDGNVFAANLASAIAITDAASRDNVVEGNLIGLDATGITPAGNATGIALAAQATGTKVFANIISGNTIDGILADNTSTEFGRIITRIEDNYIGPDKSGDQGPGNEGCGIKVRGLSKNVNIKNNRIWHNALCGVEISGGNARDNTVTRNSITRNNGRAILVTQGANNGVEAPAIAVAAAERVTGAACPGCTIEVFSDGFDEAESYEGTTVADAAGAWVLEKPGGFKYRFVTTTATDGKNTSALSKAKIVAGGVRPTRTPTIIPGQTPTATSTPGIVLFGIRLPWVGNRVLVRR
ncbi:MAG: right-handed parallel beta-helix repeat-containing protein [Anaerolineae bacterium]